MTIQVSTVPSQGDGAMRNAAVAELQNVFGVSAQSLADHVMLCLPPGTMSGVAYAYIDWYLSVFNNGWCNSPSAQMREFFENGNLLLV